VFAWQIRWDEPYESRRFGRSNLILIFWGLSFLVACDMKPDYAWKFHVPISSPPWQERENFRPFSHARRVSRIAINCKVVR